MMPALDALDAERQVLLEQVERDEQELSRAVDDLKDVVSRPLKIVERVAEAPAPWVLGGILIGLWLGSRLGNHTDD